MSFPRYPAYKPSGVEWLGEVPEHWDVLPLRRLIREVISGTSVNAIHEPAEPGQAGVLKTSCVYTGDFRPEENKAILESELDRATCPVVAGSLVVSRMNTPDLVGAAGLVKKDHPFLFLPDRLWQVSFRDCAPAFMNYWCKSVSYRTQVQLACSGTSSSMQNLSQDNFYSFIAPLPPTGEQVAIATFLDRETAKIDALIAEQQRLITLLQEKRQAVISHAVTKGLNPDAPMKDSGVEWLGEVPEHWEITKLKRITQQISVGIVVEPSKYYDDEGDVPALRSLNVKPCKIDIEVCVYISRRSNELFAKSILRAGDLVLVRTGQPGNCAVVPESLDGCNCIDLIFARKPHQGCSDYLMYQLSSDAARHQYDLGSDGAIQQHFNVKTATNLIIAWPTDCEQRAISSYLNTTLEKLDDMIKTTFSTVLLLQERRSALISAAVTGQIDVRGMVPEVEAA